MQKKVVLTSTNKAKRNAVMNFFSKMYNDVDFEFIEVESGVSNTPHFDEEGIQGAINRIEEVKKRHKGGDLYIGLEGIISKNKFGVFICGWCVIEDISRKRIGMGCSAKVKMPEYFENKIDSFGELSNVVKENYDSDLVSEMDKIGSNGVITSKLYTRVDEFEDAIKCAFGFLNNGKNFS